tara:strand:+ start:9985 stop:10653 length:669 start_codon:yes stop_codon:yes gene_type:complete
MILGMNYKQTQQSGFTLIEMIVSLGVFSIVITIAVGALLVLISSNDQLQKEQTVMTNLSFAVDSMAREIRTGTQYFCDSRPNKNAGAAGEKIFRDGDVLNSTSVQDCPNGNDSDRDYHGISFVEGGRSITGTDNTRIVYFYDATDGKIYRRISGQAAQSIVSSGAYITNAEFYVTDSAPLSDGVGEHDQPSVTIFIEAMDSNDPTNKTYQLQTTITQRALDI